MLNGLYNNKPTIELINKLYEKKIFFIKNEVIYIL